MNPALDAAWRTCQRRRLRQLQDTLDYTRNDPRYSLRNAHLETDRDQLLRLLGPELTRSREAGQ